MTSSYIKFNKIFIIESLKDNELKTGTILKDDVLRWKEFNEKFPIKTKLYSPNSSSNFFNILELIEKICLKKNGTRPIIHFEIHGSSDKKGLVLSSGDLITWKQLIDSIRKINIITNNNLFFTMAVCYGAYIFNAVRIHLPAPFRGMIGSEEEITNEDLMIRYHEFYNELFVSFDITKAFDILKKANIKIDNTYRFIDSENAFKIIYKNYLNENTSDEGINERIKQVKKDEKLEFKIRQQERKFNRDFKKEVLKTRQKYYTKHSEVFFMIDKFPENRSRFNIPKNYKTLMN